MSPVVAGLSVFCLLAGLLLALDGLLSRPRRESTGSSTSLWTTVDNWWRSRTRVQRLHLGGSLLAGVVGFLFTGWLVALVGIPVVALGVPALLAEPGNRDIDTLEALDRWVRALAASLPTGKSITDAMRVTAPQAPALIQPQLRVMVARLDARWTTQEALLALADDLDSADADAVVAALVLAARRGGVGATATLNELADTIQIRLRSLREIEAERAKPRVVVRQVTMISLLALSAAVVFQPDFFTPYRTPLGQVLVVALALAYCASLLVMRRMTIPRRRERILQRRSVVSLQEQSAVVARRGLRVRHA